MESTPETGLIVTFVLAPSRSWRLRTRPRSSPAVPGLSAEMMVAEPVTFRPTPNTLSVA